MHVISQALEAQIPLSIPILSDLGKGPLKRAFGTARSDPEATSQLLALWPKLVLSAKNPLVADKHINSASNAMCVYLNSGAASPVPEIRNFIFSKEVWFDAFQCAHRAFDAGKTKPTFQVMETLCGLSQKAGDQEIYRGVLADASLPLISTILISSPRSGLKKACLMLSCLLQKTALFSIFQPLVQRVTTEHYLLWLQRLSQHNIIPVHGSDIGKGSMESLLLALILASIDQDTRSAALKLCSILCAHDPQNAESKTLQPLAENAMRLYLENNHAALGEFAHNVLPVVVSNRKRFMTFIGPYTSSSHKSESQVALLFAALRVGGSKNILNEAEILQILNSAFTSTTSLSDVGSHEYQWFEHSLKAASSEVRIFAYALLASPTTATSIVPTGVLVCISSNLKYMHEDADAHERGEILSITRRLLRRIQMSYSTLRKEAITSDNVNGNDNGLVQYRTFVDRFYNVLKDELGPAVSYPRHILGLLSLQCFMDSAIESDFVYNDENLVRSLCNLVLDPFEDVRGLAMTLLQVLTAQQPDLLSGAVGTTFLNKVESLAIQTVRGDHADALGRFWALWASSSNNDIRSTEHGRDSAADASLSKHISQLEQLVADNKNLRPGSDIALHGSLLAVHYRLQSLQDRPDQGATFDAMQVLGVCLGVWKQVRIHLCVDSPETASELEDTDGSAGPKDLLAYSWRALRDASLVMQTLIIVSQPSQELYSCAGDMCMDQLTSLRHRGAFSTVAQTFHVCCEKVRTATDLAVRGLIKQWYTIALNQIDEQADRLTRRSAGLPAMLTALLSPADSNFFSSVIYDLVNIARRPSLADEVDDQGEARLPQVHALNCLREIMTSTRFSIVVSRFLSTMLELAATCLSSKVWAIRNCGLMLLRAGIHRLRLASPQENSLSTKHLGEQPVEDTPRTIAVRLLELAAEEPSNGPFSTQNNATEHVFAALDLLGHAVGGDAATEEIVNIISRELSNPTWAVRDHAAFLIASRLADVGPFLAIDKLIKATQPTGCGNQVQGVLICCRYILNVRKESLTEVELGNIISLLDETLTISTGTMYPCSPYVDAAWLDILNDAAVLIWNNHWGHEFIRNKYSTDRHQLGRMNSEHSSYVSRRILLHKTYLHLLQEAVDANPGISMQALIADLIANPDDLYYVFEVVTQEHCNKPLHWVVFIIRLMRKSYEELSTHPNLLERAFNCLAQCLQYLEDIHPDLLQVMIRTVDLRRLVITRGVWNATLKLEAHILGLSLHSQENIGQRSLYWLRAVEHAAGDSLDFPTRLSAATALSTYIRYMQYSEATAQSQDIRLRVLLILQGLLNDDDEDVRLEAVSAARQLKLHRIPAVDSLGLCALAARESLLEELIQHYGQTTALSEAAMVKLMRVGQTGNNAIQTDNVAVLFKNSVATILLRIRKARNDLFAEERQNLYIDDIREIYSWTRILHRCRFSSSIKEQTEAVLEWTSKGLNQVLQIVHVDQSSRHPTQPQALLESNDWNADPVSGHPLGATYDSQVLVVFLQVVSLAGILLDSERPLKYQEQLRKDLEQIRSMCFQTHAHEAFTIAIDNALADHQSQRSPGTTGR